MILSIPYPSHPKPPFWGPPTAHINFCEEDYILTSFVAEFANSLTNIFYVIYALHGLVNLRPRTWASALPLIGLAGVGVCSGAYHVTLHEIPQLADDLSMIFPTAFVLLRLLTFQVRDPKVAGRITAALAVALLTVYTVHLNINMPYLHALTFGVMVHFIRGKIWGLLSDRMPDPRGRGKLRRAALIGGISFVSGYLLWLIDRFACGSLTRAKHALGLPWAFILELHAWWHVLTAIGAYVYIVLADVLTSEQVGQFREDAFGWPAKQILGRYTGRRQSLLAEENTKRKAKIHSN